MDLFKEIKQVVSQQLGVKPEAITPAASFRHDLGSDSLDAIVLIMALEDKFSIKIPDEDAEAMVTVNDVIKYIENKINLSRSIGQNEGGH